MTRSPTGRVVVLLVLLTVSLTVGLTAVSGAAAADMPDDSQCSAIAWSTQSISGETYYEVDTLDKLQCIDSQGLGNNYVLTKDIDASPTAGWNDSKGFDPIGEFDPAFTGTFDGDNHTISELTINRGGRGNVGLFSVVGSAGTVRNVGLEGGSVTGRAKTGQLVGVNDGTIVDSHVTGEVNGSYRVGGLVGQNTGTVRRAYATGERTRGNNSVGGLAGFNGGTIDRSFAARAVVSEESNVEGTVDGVLAGGLVGTSTGTITDSYATGPVTAALVAGGVLGAYPGLDDGTTRRTYATGAVSVPDPSDGIGGLVGGFYTTGTTTADSYWDVGTTGATNGTGSIPPQTTVDISGFGATTDSAPAPEMLGASAVTNMSSLSFQDTWETVESDDPDAAVDGYPILQGLNRTVQLRVQGVTTATAPSAANCASLSWSTREVSGETYYEVDSLYKLQCIEEQGLGNNYVLTEDIDASPTAGWNDSKGFDPIGEFDPDFTGTFDGDNHTISGLTIDRPERSAVGLFGGVASGGTVTNVDLDGGSVTGDGSVGAVVGRNRGLVSGVTATGDVAGNDISVGGVVGLNSGTVERSVATGDVSNPNANNVGGLVGFHTGTVRESYATGDVTGETDGSAYAGGLVGGEGGGTVVDSYATGNVTAGGRIVGGLVASTSSGLVRRSYATGAVSGADNEGGLLGESGGGTIENSYWDQGTTNLWTPIGADYGTTNALVGFGSTTDTEPAPEMLGASAATKMTNLSFPGTWETVERTDPDAAADGYPILQALGREAQLRAQGIVEPAPTPADCEALSWSTRTISSETYFEVDSLLKLQCIETQGLGNNYVLTDDIDASPTAEWNVDGESASGFDPLGNDSNRFTGTFDGNGYRVSGLTINREGTDNVGLFGSLDTGTVANVTVENATVTGGEYVGTLVGTSRGTIQDVHVNGTVTGDGTVGGLVGFAIGSHIDTATSTGDVTGTEDYVGGLVGYTSGPVSNATATGAVVGDRSVGGLVGGSVASVRNASATGNATGNGIGNRVGGLVGYSEGTVTNASASGDSVGDTGVGGLVGQNFLGAVRDSAATGSATGDSYIGGLVGDNRAAVNRSYATGAADTDDADDVGGLIGWNQGTVDSSYATGTVTGNQSIGGLVGNNDAVINESYAIGSVTGSEAVGGLVGSDEGTVTDAYWDTEASGTSVSAAGVGLSTAEMTGRAAEGNMGGFDFTETWALTPRQPRLRWSLASVPELPPEPTSGPTRRSGSSSSSSGSDVRVTAGDGGPDGAWRVDISNPATDEPVEIPLGDGTTDSGTERDVSLTGLQMNVNGGSDFELDITSSDAGGDETEQSFATETGSQSLGTITVDHTVADDDIDDVTFTVNLRKSRLAESELDPESVALYRDETTRWNRLPTTVVGETDSQYTFEATSPGLSTFVIGAAPAAADQPAASDDSTAADEPATTDDESPGFGLGLTGLAVLVSGFVARLFGSRAGGTAD